MKAASISHDRRLSAGIFTVGRKRWHPKKPPIYRIVMWRTYRDRHGAERVATSLHRDEIDPAVALLVKCADRLSAGGQ
jgi:hypothetical protein